MAVAVVAMLAPFAGCSYDGPATRPRGEGDSDTPRTAQAPDPTDGAPKLVIEQVGGTPTVEPHAESLAPPSGVITVIEMPL